MHRRRERGRQNHTPEADHGPGKQIILFLPADMDNLGQRKFFEGFVFSTIESLAQNLIAYTPGRTVGFYLLPVGFAQNGMV